jgi:hypothetical protein
MCASGANIGGDGGAGSRRTEYLAGGVEAPAGEATDARAGGFVLTAGARRATVDARLAARLSEHQSEGLWWLYEAFHGEHRAGWRGAILGDGMGVGKTLQLLALAHTLIGERQASCIAIVVPSNLVSNWQQEVSKWVVDVEPHVERALPVAFVGDGAQRTAARTALGALRDARIGAPRVAVLSYTQLLIHGSWFRMHRVRIWSG